MEPVRIITVGGGRADGEATDSERNAKTKPRQPAVSFTGSRRLYRLLRKGVVGSAEKKFVEEEMSMES